MSFTLRYMMIALLAALPATGARAAEGDWSGYVAAELRLFPQAPLDSDQHGNNLSLSAEPEYYLDWDDGRQAFTFTPFLRLDQHDPERSHVDIRELTWLKAADTWELRLGVRKVFWGVTESQHLVDIVNQTDTVENLDGEDKLGQPMLNLALIRDWGTVDLFLLAGFRERTFPGPDGRPRTQPLVDTDQAGYESGAEQRHLDWAVRWSHSVGDWDLGLSHFYGTGREPTLVPRLDLSGVTLTPLYPIIHQSGLDLQATKGDWLWKLEVIHRSGQGETFNAATGGFEYTLVGVGKTPADLGLLAEYLYDDRGDSAPTPFQDDLFLGARLTLNDAQSSELLAGVIADPGDGTRFYNLEASRRLGDTWKLSLEARFIAGPPPEDPLYGLRRDDYFQVELARWF